LLSTLLLSHEKQIDSFKIIFTDNTAATGGPNDLGQTGDLEFIYTSPENNYKFSMKGEVFVNLYPGDNNVTRENPNNARIDLFSAYFVQGADFKYGFGVEILGNLGGGPIQNFIHKLTSNPHIPAKYFGHTHATPTMNYEYTASIFNDRIDFVSTGKIPFIYRYGIFKLDAMMTYTSSDLYETGIGGGMGLGFNCTRYPSMLAFKGYPLGDYQVCTPETKLSLKYKKFDFFWEIPLMNTNVQNSVLGISYSF